MVGNINSTRDDADAVAPLKLEMEKHLDVLSRYNPFRLTRPEMSRLTMNQYQRMSQEYSALWNLYRSDSKAFTAVLENIDKEAGGNDVAAHDFLTRIKSMADMRPQIEPLLQNLNDTNPRYITHQDPTLGDAKRKKLAEADAGLRQLHASDPVTFEKVLHTIDVEVEGKNRAVACLLEQIQK